MKHNLWECHFGITNPAEFLQSLTQKNSLHIREIKLCSISGPKKMKIVQSPFQWKWHIVGPPVNHRGKLCTYIRMFWIIDAHVCYLESLENLRFHMTDSGDELRESRVQLIGSQGPAHLRDVLQWHRILYLLLVYIWNTVKA